jgi:spectinomycin phosphotransferase
MRDRPAGLTDGEVALTLARHWHIDAASLRYVPAGAGGYHWSVTDAGGCRWFATADDLDAKAWLGGDRDSVRAGLAVAMDTAAALRRSGLAFVLAPVPAADGASVVPAGPRYTLSVFPFTDGASGRWGEEPPPGQAEQVAGLLAALHQAAPPATGIRRAQAGLPRRAGLEAALADLGRPWRGGPFAEPARVMLTAAAGRVRGMLDALDQLAGGVRAAADLVITHGEPHHGNVIRTGAGLMLIDWDTVGLAPAERDLWMLTGGDDAPARRYAAATGRVPDPSRLAFYRLRWALDDISVYAAALRAPHERTPGTQDIRDRLAAALREAGPAG